MDIQTTCIHGNRDLSNCFGSVSVPIFQTATFSHPGVGRSTGYDYSRLQNPTRESLEKMIASLEHGVDALAFSTGMAAIASLMELFEIGDHIITSSDLYGGSYRLFHHISEKNGLRFSSIKTAELHLIQQHIEPNTKAIFIETPTNPMMQVTDIASVAGLAHNHGLLLIVDNTFLTPYFQNPIDLGADIVVHSGTKYLGGHNDTLAGFLVPATQELSDRLRFVFKTTGACLSPFDSWLILRGIKTLAVRLEKQQESAMVLADWLCLQPKVKAVHYIGLPTHPDYEISRKQARGFGAMISFEVDSAETARHLLEKLTLILFAESLGGVETLITYPMFQTHAELPQDEREAKGIHDRLLRLSVGLESVSDLKADLEQALGGEIAT